jgi:hypothetical protein
MLATLQIGTAQRPNQIFLGLGGSLGEYQDLKQGDVVFSGGGFNFQIGYERQVEDIFRFRLGGSLLTSSVNNIDATEAKLILPYLQLGWLKNLNTTDKLRIYAGAGLDAKFVLRNADNLGNNGTAFVYANTLSALGRLEYGLGESQNWTGSFELGVGLFGWIKENVGFAFTAPQEYLEKGKFDYLQTDAVTNLYKYGEMAFLGKNTQINTAISLYKDGERGRFGITYMWDLMSYAQIENYRFTKGEHGLVISYGLKFGEKKWR